MIPRVASPTKTWPVLIPARSVGVTPRACGICGASHLTCAAWALDTAWGTTVPRNAILARNLGQIVESLQSLPRHHYGLWMIDYTNENYAMSPFYEEAVKRYSPFTGTSYEAGVINSAPPAEIYALLGGQWPHSSFMVPGGVMCSPTLTDITRAYGAVHAADRGDAFRFSTEFDAVRERLAYLRDHPDLSSLEPALLEVAAQMSHISKELAEVYSDERVNRARSFLEQRQYEVAPSTSRPAHATPARGIRSEGMRERIQPGSRP